MRDQKIIRSTNQLSELQTLKRRILGWVRPFWLMRTGQKNLQLIQGNLFEIIRSYFSALGKGDSLRTGPVCPATGTVAKENLRLVGRLIQEMKEVLGKQLVLILVPVESELREYSNDMVCDLVRVYRRIEAFAKSHEIPFVRLHEQFMLHQSKELFIDGGHLNDYGHEVVAEELAKFVRNYIQGNE